MEIRKCRSGGGAFGPIEGNGSAWSRSRCRQPWRCRHDAGGPSQMAEGLTGGCGIELGSEKFRRLNSPDRQQPGDGTNRLVAIRAEARRVASR